MQNGRGRNQELIEFTKIGLIHSPSGRLLTSETFQGVLNVQGVSLKRKQIWTLCVEPKNPTAFLLQNHQGKFLNADTNGNVSLVEEPGAEGRFIIHFDRRASGEIALQSEAHKFFLHWTGTEIRCFSKEPVWWGMRLGMHAQVHLRSVYRNCFIRSAKKDSELRAVTKMPSSPKFLLWLEQLPLPPASGPGSKGCTKGQVAKLSRVALRTQSGRYFSSGGELVNTINEATLFAVSFKPSTSQMLSFQDENGEYLTVGSGGVLKIKAGAREPRREEIFAIETPTIHVRLWAFNNKFACNKNGLTFSTNMEETEEQKNIVYQLEYVGGGSGVNINAIVNAPAAPSGDSSPGAGGAEDDSPYFTSGLWRLRARDGRLWQIPPSGPADLVPKDSKDPSTTFELLYVPSYQEGGNGTGKPKVEPRGGVVIRTSDGRMAAVKPLGALSVTDHVADAEGWQPTIPEILHLLPMVNRSSVACYSPLASGYLAPTSSNSTARRANSTVDCSICISHQWFLRHLNMGTVQFFTKMDNQWMMLSATGQGTVTLAPSAFGPDKPEDGLDSSPETEFVICLANEKYALLRSLLQIGGQRRPSYLTANLQGGVKLEAPGVITPGSIWQL
ncbi:hypothetical protein Aperf_G00000109691 [Anoplocephala perfoliata]